MSRPRSPLTPREAAILDGLTHGKMNKTIGRELGIATETVKVHVKTILRKLGVANRTEAAVLATRAERQLSQALPAIPE